MNPLSGVLSEAWQYYRKFAGHLLAIAFVIYVVAAIIAALLSLAGFVGPLLAVVVELFAGFLLQAALVKSVQDIRDGRADLSVGETVSAGLRDIWPVAAASILASQPGGVSACRRLSAPPVSCSVGRPPGRLTTPMSRHQTPPRSPVPSAFEHASLAAKRLA